MTPIVNFILSILTLLAQIFLLWIVVFSLIAPEQIKKIASKFLFSKNAVLLAFIVSLLASSGSLFYSQIAGFVPCELCWFQRIFMYPQVVLLGIALFKKESKIIDYSLGLASVGIIISLYQNYLVYTATQSTTCSLTGTSCATKIILGLNYVTIPLMAFTAFTLIITIFILHKISNHAE